MAKKIIKKSKKITKVVKAKPKKIKIYGKRDLAFFKSIILEKRKETLENLQLLKSYMVDPNTGENQNEISSYSLHMEQGTDTMEREKTYLFAARDTKYLNYLNEALLRIEKGGYGVCSDCNKLIESKRLLAVPITQLCVKCKLSK